MGTQLLAPLNTVHVKYRGFFKDDYKSCCSKPLREVGTEPAGQPPAVQHICSSAGAQSRGNLAQLELLLDFVRSSISQAAAHQQGLLVLELHCTSAAVTFGPSGAQSKSHSMCSAGPTTLLPPEHGRCCSSNHQRRVSHLSTCCAQPSTPPHRFLTPLAVLPAVHGEAMRAGLWGAASRQ